MTIMILQPNEERQMGLTGGFLMVRRTEGTVKISSPDEGLVDTEIYQSDIIELKGYRSIAVKNYSPVEVTIDLQSSMVPIRSNDGGSVTISGGSIDSILEPITVEATATFNDANIVTAVNASTAETNESGLAIVAEIQGQTTDLNTIVSTQTGALNTQSASDRAALESKIDELLLSLAASRAGSKYVNTGTVAAGSGTGDFEVLPVRATRRKALITPSDTVRIGGATGMYVGVGDSFLWESQSACSVYKYGSRTFTVVEEFD
jgi:hypothetical protein